MVECHLAKVDVEGSNPFSRSTKARYFRAFAFQARALSTNSPVSDAPARFSCIDPETGKSLWRTTPFGEYWSMATNRSQLLTLDERGDLRLINANPSEFSQVSERHVSDTSTWAHLAIADDQVFVRALDALIVFRWHE